MTQLDRLHSVQMKIAREVKRICEKNDIRYFLEAGTMLGAVRHKGFIPWDDDMDFGMLKEDYDRFLEIAPSELSEEFFLDNYENNDEYGLVFSKVRLKNTIFIELKGNEKAKHNEIFVDIFSYYPIADKKLTRKFEAKVMTIIAHAIMSKSGYKVWKGDGLLKRLKFIPTDIIGMVLTKKRMFSIINNYYNKHKNTRCVCLHGGSFYDSIIMDKNLFKEYVDVEFEKEVFKIPAAYDEILRICYGDYMTLPPEEDRVTHGYVKLEFEK